MDQPTEQELRAFVGRNADYYLERWRPYREGISVRTRVNWAALLLSGLWLPFRKMYKITAILLVLILIESSFEELVLNDLLDQPKLAETIGRLVGIAVAFTCGSLGNHWYWSYACKVIADVRSQGLPEDVHLQTLAKRGGTSVLAAVATLLLFLAATFLIVVFTEIVFDMATGD